MVRFTNPLNPESNPDDLGNRPVEEIELMLQKVARGNLPSDGDVLFRVNGRWVFSPLNLQGIVSGNFLFPLDSIGGGRTEQYVIENALTRNIRPTDIILVSGSENKNPNMLTQARGGQGTFDLFIQNTDTGNQQTTTDGVQREGKFIAFRVLV